MIWVIAFPNLGLPVVPRLLHLQPTEQNVANKHCGLSCIFVSIQRHLYLNWTLFVVVHLSNKNNECQFPSTQINEHILSELSLLHEYLLLFQIKWNIFVKNNSCFMTEIMSDTMTFPLYWKFTPQWKWSRNLLYSTAPVCSHKRK